MMSRWDGLRSSPIDKRSDGPISRSTRKGNRRREINQLSSSEEKKDSESFTPVFRGSRAKQAHWRQQQRTNCSPDISNVRPPVIAFPPSAVSAMPRNAAPPLSYTERTRVVACLRNELLYFRGSGGFRNLPIPAMRDRVKKLRRFDSVETTTVVLLLADLLQIPYADVDDLAATILEERLEAVSRTSMTFFTQPVTLHLIRQISFHCSALFFRHPQSYARLLRCLALVVQSHRSLLPGEETAQTVVGSIFLPYIENDSIRGIIAMEEIKSGSNKGTYGYVCEAMKLLLLDPKHSSALLAPLVNDISINDGKEEQSMNPLRSRILAGFARPLIGRDKARADEQLEACYALATAVVAIEMLDASIGVVPGEGSNLVQSVESFILDVLKETEDPNSMAAKLENLRSAVLRLLKALVSLYPGAVTGLGWKLMVEGCDPYVSSLSSTKNQSQTRQLCTTAVSRPDSTFLPCLINSNPTTTMDIEMSVRAIECLEGFTSALPWKIWLEQDRQRPIHVSANPSSARTSTSSGLYRRATTALETFLRTSLRSFHSCQSSTIQDALGSLLRCLFKEIPFCNGKLIQAGEDLWSSLTCYVLCPSENKHKSDVAKQILLESLGGTTTPQGQLVPACIPALLWLVENESSSVSFLDKVIESIKNDDDNSDDSIKLLSAMLRTLPDLAFKRWEGFCNLLERLSENDVVERRLVCLEILRAFKAGKRDFGFQMKHEKSKKKDVLELACLVLDGTFSLDLTGMTASNTQCHRLIMAVYAAFLDEDWRLLDANEGEVIRHLHRMLEWCQHSIPTVREAACKSVGEFATQYGTAIRPVSDQVDIKVHQYRLIVEEICGVMLQVCTDQNAGVRSMSIFALGNLVCELRGRSHKEFLTLERVSEICEAILEGLSDKNDKVVGNSIRSLGHAGSLFVRCLVDSHERDNLAYLRLLNRVVCALSDRISVALDVALNTNAKSKSSLTWKQRSAAKKHGWGACHSLGLVFQPLTVEIAQMEPALASSLSEVLRQLVLCFTYREKLNEKVVNGAMVAICSMPSLVLVEAGRANGLVGDALTSSVALLYDSLMLDIGQSFSLQESKTMDEKLTKQNEQLLHRLLGSASINDAFMVLKDERISTRSLDWLYTWMVDQHAGVLDGSSFEVFALALQRPGQSSDNVALEQKFASRAHQKYKHDQEIRADGTPREDGDGADEL